MLVSILFYWKSIAIEWENYFELLRLYRSINGNNSVPRSHATKEGVIPGPPTMRVALLRLMFAYYNTTFNDDI